VKYSDYPVLAEFFKLRTESSIRLGFEPKWPILFYTGGNGPRIMEIAGRVMDGVLIGGFFIPLVRSGKLAGLLEKAERGRKDAGLQAALRKVCEINISVSNDYNTARTFPKRYIAHMLVVLEAMGFSDEEFNALGVDRKTVIQIKEAFVVGGIKRLEEMCAYAHQFGFDQICLAKLGPDYEEAITVLSRDLLPGIVQR